jgi:hypothetical protein
MKGLEAVRRFEGTKFYPRLCSQQRDRVIVIETRWSLVHRHRALLLWQHVIFTCGETAGFSRLSINLCGPKCSTSESQEDSQSGTAVLKLVRIFTQKLRI